MGISNPAAGNAYTQAEFQQQYSGVAEWNAAGARQMATEAARWQRRVLALWNANTSSFDTLHMTYPPKPPAPPPGASARAEGDHAGSRSVRAGSFLDDEVDAWPTVPGCKPQKRKCRALSCMCITVNAGNPQCCFAGVRELASLTSPWHVLRTLPSLYCAIGKRSTLCT